MSNRFFENQPNEICSHLSEKASQGGFVKPKKLLNHSNEEKGKEKKKERGDGKEEKGRKAMVALLKDPFCDNVSKIQLDVHSHLSGTQAVTAQYHFVAVPRHWFPHIKCGQPLSL